MNVAVRNENATRATGAIPQYWNNAFDVLKSSTGRWQYGRRLTRSSPDYIEPQPFCDKVLADAMCDRRFLNTAERADFFDWACGQPNIKAFVCILAAHDLLARADRMRALRHLDLALILDQEDLYAQELWFAARGKPIQPVDTTKRVCANPFERIESASRNRLMFCCPAWLPVAAGSLEDDTVEAVWNSPAAQDIRASIHDGSYRYCSRMHCPMFTDDRLPYVEKIKSSAIREAWQSKATVLPLKIKRVSLAHDRSCNLSCPSCRTKLLIADRAENDRLDALIDKALMPLLLASAKVVITGSGDPFSSKHYRNIIRRITDLPPGPKIDLQTNGLMLARSWDELGLEGRVGNVLVSIDAASKETYEIIRRGGIFEELIENLGFLSDLRKRGLVKCVRLDFVTQALNFREMPAAAALMRSFDFDVIKFQMLRSWNTWSPEDFRRQHVGHPSHAEYGELQQIMHHPNLAKPDVQFFGFYSLASNNTSSDARSAPSSALSNGDSRQAANLA